MSSLFGDLVFGVDGFGELPEVTPELSSVLSSEAELSIIFDFVESLVASLTPEVVVATFFDAVIFATLQPEGELSTSFDSIFSLTVGLITESELSVYFNEWLFSLLNPEAELSFSADLYKDLIISLLPEAVLSIVLFEFYALVATLIPEAGLLCYFDGRRPMMPFIEDYDLVPVMPIAKLKPVMPILEKWPSRIVISLEDDYEAGDAP